MNPLAPSGAEVPCRQRRTQQKRPQSNKCRTASKSSGPHPAGAPLLPSGYLTRCVIFIRHFCGASGRHICRVALWSRRKQRNCGRLPTLRRQRFALAALRASSPHAHSQGVLCGVRMVVAGGVGVAIARLAHSWAAARRGLLQQLCCSKLVPSLKRSSPELPRGRRRVAVAIGAGV